ncbi:hypothetical protein F5141DRAFT_773579 [Pisolithus sp. B1]|nr:hypothetical protein F5141DRAFT_773579 [Pisolithus sp. B1]
MSVYVRLYETSVLVGAEVPDELPTTVYDPSPRDSQWKLHSSLTGGTKNQGTPVSLQRRKKKTTIIVRPKGRPQHCHTSDTARSRGFACRQRQKSGDEEWGSGFTGESRVGKLRTKRTRGRSRGT